VRNFCTVFKGAQSAPCELATVHARAPRHEIMVPDAAHWLFVTAWHLTALARSPVAGPAALRPCRATAAPDMASGDHPSGALILKLCKFAVKPGL